ncbi:cation:proton antiporter domain-containing protein [Puniceicoccus vermicola]|uniref:Cation:proton antiporter n=1 Tax=Puniceicoccus vermicola TaxID=388746 RepID=A0A7X1B206_9BACT|nr:cation:proton antiporter [Puniceicoccus vermicola]
MTLLLIFLLLLFGYSLLSKKVEGSYVTAPMIFAGAGLILAFVIDEPVSADKGLTPFLHVAEIALVLLLFCDASKVDLSLLRKEKSLPLRLLGPGMLLTIGLGTLVAVLIFPQLSGWEAALLATILAPTDASLGQVIVNSERVPKKIREALDVEAGLNDGLSVPFLLFFIAIVSVDAGESSSSLPVLMGEQIGYGAIVGIGVGLLGGWLLNVATRMQSMDSIHRPLAVVVLPILAYLLSHHIEGSPFIAAYVAGLVTQKAFPKIQEGSITFTDEWGESLSFAVFFLFGIFAGSPDAGISWLPLLYGILSLAVIRTISTFLALPGTGLSIREKTFLGWFGPRGLASIVLGLVYLEAEAQLPGESTITAVVISTVLLSIFLHGLSARPGIRWIAKKS